MTPCVHLLPARQAAQTAGSCCAGRVWFRPAPADRRPIGAPADVRAGHDSVWLRRPWRLVLRRFFRRPSGPIANRKRWPPGPGPAAVNRRTGLSAGRGLWAQQQVPRWPGPVSAPQVRPARLGPAPCLPLIQLLLAHVPQGLLPDFPQNFWLERCHGRSLRCPQPCPRQTTRRALNAHGGRGHNGHGCGVHAAGGPGLLPGPRRAPACRWMMPGRPGCRLRPSPPRRRGGRRQSCRPGCR